MCTAINYKRQNSKNLFGRTLDVVASYGEGVVITPRDHGFKMRSGEIISKHPAIIGAAVIKDGVPLYYDAANEYGLSAAALNFPISSVYNEPREDCCNVASFELIRFVLSKCKNVDEARKLLLRTNVTSEAFSGTLEPTPLHWIISDAHNSIVAEPMAQGLVLNDDRFNVLTNEPPFEYHAKHVSLFANLTVGQPNGALAQKTELYSNGMGAIGLPGDLSSVSRFVRAFFFNEYCESLPTKADKNTEVERFFSVASQVTVPYGAVIDANGKKPFTVYTSCIDTSDMTYYFRTYGNTMIRAVRLSQKEANKKTLSVFSMDGETGPEFLN